MAAIDSLCVLVETEEVTGESGLPRYGIKRVVRAYESRSRAEEDLELLQATAVQLGARYRIDDIPHIER